MFDIYFYGAITIGFVFSMVGMIEPDRYEYPYFVILAAFLAWPIVLPFVVYELFKLDWIKK